MPAMDPALHPIVSCDEAKRFEAARFGGDEAREWTAMQAAGRSVGRAVRADFEEIGGFPAAGRILVLAGKGHNGGDALIAAGGIAAAHPDARIDVWLAFGERALRPLALRAYRELVQSASGRVAAADAAALAPVYDLVLDGLFGFPFRPPLDAVSQAILAAVDRVGARLRAAVDLPSGLGEAGAFRADFSYATGLVKTPLLGLPNAGRLRYLDLGFAAAGAFPEAADWVADAEVLAPLRGFRPAACDKRSFGHLFVLGGSRSYPGAVLMSVLAALRSGVGLVTAFVPASLAAAFAARAPEAMWVGWPETPDGGLAMEGSHLLRERLARADAFLIGPGLAREGETLALVLDTVKASPVPLVLDADALQPEIVRAAARRACIITPHAGEFARVAGASGLRVFSAETGIVTLLKGPVTRICDGRTTVHSFFGGPVLARGGSGDLLAGLVGGLLAQQPGDPRMAAVRGAVWHGLAADRLARERGAVAVPTTQLLDHLAGALRG